MFSQLCHALVYAIDASPVYFPGFNYELMLVKEAGLQYRSLHELQPVFDHRMYICQIR